MVMSIQEVRRARFDRWLDDIVENVVGSNETSPQLRTEFVKWANLLRRVAEYDIELAADVHIGAIMLAYTLGISIIGKAS